MKTGYLTLIFALACAACTPRFYPPKVDVPDGYLYGEGFPRDTAALASDCSGTRCSTTSCSGRWRTTATWP